MRCSLVALLVVLCGCQFGKPAGGGVGRREVDSEVGVLLAEDGEELLIARAKVGHYPTGPVLAGTIVGCAKGRVALRVSDNPGNIDIQRSLDAGAISLLVWHEQGVTAELLATGYDAAENVLRCRVVDRMGPRPIRISDKAHTP